MKKQIKNMLINAYREYLNAGDNRRGAHALYNVYGRPSDIKRRIWYMLTRVDPEAVIVSYNSQKFSAAYTCIDSKTGELLFVFDTGYKAYPVNICDIDAAALDPENVNFNLLEA